MRKAGGYMQCVQLNSIRPPGQSASLRRVGGVCLFLANSHHLLSIVKISCLLLVPAVSIGRQPSQTTHPRKTVMAKLNQPNKGRYLRHKSERHLCDLPGRESSGLCSTYMEVDTYLTPHTPPSIPYHSMTTSSSTAAHRRKSLAPQCPQSAR
jgi:hypothetical protein